MIKLILYYKELISLKLALFFLSLSGLSKVEKENETVQSWYENYIKIYLGYFKEVLDECDGK